MSTFNDLTGKSYSRLMALHRVANEGGHTMWRCLCDCGAVRIVRAQHLRNGNTKSCGCWDADVLATRSTKHGMCGTPTYSTWASMIQRCCNPAHSDYHDYGGRGIIVCKPWRKFAKFYSDMGLRPDGLTLDRANTNGNYSLSNCRWATSQQQANNKRTNRWIVHGAERQTLSAWAEKFGVYPSTLHKRITRTSEQAALTYYLGKT